MKYSYVSLLTDDTYTPGIILLSETLKEVKSKYPLFVLVTDNVSPPCLEILNQINIQYKKIDNIEMPDYIQKHNNYLNPRQAGIWKNCWTKFHIFNQTQFDKIVFLDADILILKNLDNLFNKPHMTAAMDGEYFNLWTDGHFNGGCIVIEPSEELFNNIKDFAFHYIPKETDSILADQEILNHYFNDWPSNKKLHLNKYYNIFAPYILEEQLEDIKKNCYFIHFIGRKPWLPFLKPNNENYPEYHYDIANKIIQIKFNSFNWQKIQALLKLTVYAICKDEMKNVKKWLDCFGQADYVCVLDTGSTDGTWEFLQEESKKRKNLIIDQKIIDPWRFDTARNESMKIIPKDTIIYFMADLDELIKQDNWVNMIKSYWTPIFSRGKYTYFRNVGEGDIIQKTMNEYRIHSKKWQKWVQIVHECLINDYGEKFFYDFACTEIPLEVWHYGEYTKSSKYAKLCEQELLEHPENALMRLQLAIEYEVNGEDELAKQHFEILIHEQPHNIQIFELARCYYGIGRYYLLRDQYQQALDYFREGRLVFPVFADNYIGAAEAYAFLQEDNKVIELLEAGIQNSIESFWCSVCDIKFWYTYFLLGKAYFNIKERYKGLGYIEYANSIAPNTEVILEIKQQIIKYLQEENNKKKEESN